MDSFLIPSVSGPASLEFFGRVPDDPGRPIETFSVRLAAGQLSAACWVYASSPESGPASLFAEMAGLWRGWDGDLAWESLEGEIRLACVQDRAGHVAIRVDLRPGIEGWTASATISVEAGQLERLARQASLWFGRAGQPYGE